jgi:hypothetical protein
MNSGSSNSMNTINKYNADNLKSKKQLVKNFIKESSRNNFINNEGDDDDDIEEDDYEEEDNESDHNSEESSKRKWKKKKINNNSNNLNSSFNNTTPHIFNGIMTPREKRVQALLEIPSKAKSSVWKYFGLYPSALCGDKKHEFAVCKICRDIYKDDAKHESKKWEVKYNSSTSKLKDHLQVHHRDQYK